MTTREMISKRLGRSDRLGAGPQTPGIFPAKRKYGRFE